MAKSNQSKGDSEKGGKPASQRGKTSGPDLSKVKPVSKEELKKEIKKFTDDLDNAPFSPNEMGRD